MQTEAEAPHAPSVTALNTVGCPIPSEPQSPHLEVGGVTATPVTDVPSYHVFRTIRRTFPHQIWEENRGASYSPNVTYIYIGEIVCYLCY